MKYRHYVDDIQEYIYILDKVTDVVDVVSQCLEQQTSVGLW